MATLTIYRNYEIINGIKVFGDVNKVIDVRVNNTIDGINDFDNAKNALWDALNAFIKDFDTPTHNGILYEFNPSEMDLYHHTEINNNIEGFAYDDGTTIWDATIYERD